MSQIEEAWQVYRTTVLAERERASNCTLPPGAERLLRASFYAGAFAGFGLPDSAEQAREVLAAVLSGDA